MKYLRLFEEKSYHYMADYIMPENKDKLIQVMTILNENHIPFDLFYHNTTEEFFQKKLFFKIYYYGTLSTEEKKILKDLDIYYLDHKYEFTWPWIKTTENDIQFLIDQQKYNL